MNSLCPKPTRDFSFMHSRKMHGIIAMVFEVITKITSKMAPLQCLRGTVTLTSVQFEAELTTEWVM